MQYLQVRTTNGNTLGFEYGDKDKTRYQVTPEGCRVPKDVAVYAARVYPFVEIFKGAIATVQVETAEEVVPEDTDSQGEPQEEVETENQLPSDLDPAVNPDEDPDP